MTKTSEVFISWLHDKLNELKTDPDVFGSYITGILEDDESIDENREALQELLSEIIEKDLQVVVSAILDKWEECKNIEPKEVVKTSPSINVEKQLAKLLEAQRIQAKVPERKYTEEERRMKEQILAQYAQTEVEDVDAFDDGIGTSVEQKPPNPSGLERNTNVEDVIQLQKEKREQARQDSAAKKQKDKDDRVKQRQLREEKKEKRKTVKGERRR